jgi:hypothetical protein
VRDFLGNTSLQRVAIDFAGLTNEIVGVGARGEYCGSGPIEGETASQETQYSSVDDMDAFLFLTVEAILIWTRTNHPGTESKATQVYCLVCRPCEDQIVDLLCRRV